MWLWAHSRFSGNVSSMSSFSKTTKSLPHTEASSRALKCIALCPHQDSPGPSQVTGHRPPKPAPRPPIQITAKRTSVVGTSSASRGPGVRFAEILSHPEKALCLGNLFGDQEARGAFQPMKTHRANKETQDPQRAPRTPGVRSQALHLCANGPD